jgi:hypothetical protein
MGGKHIGYRCRIFCNHVNLPIATTLAFLSQQFDPNVAYVVERASKKVAAVLLLQLSLEPPKFLKVYCFSKRNAVTGNANEQEKMMT